MALSGREFGMARLFSNDSSLDDVSVGETPPTRRRRLTFPENPFEEQDQTAVLRELREIKEILNGMKAKQLEMEKGLAKVTKQVAHKSFDLAKSSHVTNVTNILAKSYVQLGRFVKTNDSKTQQLQQEFVNSPYGLSVHELMSLAAALEKTKFTYWRTEERRRVLAIGSWSALEQVTAKELSAKICSLLGVKFNVALEKAVLQQTVLVRTYIAALGIQDCRKDDKFWINYYMWKEAKYGPRGPTQMEWDIIMGNQE